MQRELFGLQANTYGLKVNAMLEAGESFPDGVVMPEDALEIGPNMKVLEHNPYTESVLGLMASDTDGFLAAIENCGEDFRASSTSEDWALIMSNARSAGAAGAQLWDK